MKKALVALLLLAACSLTLVLSPAAASAKGAWVYDRYILKNSASPSNNQHKYTVKTTPGNITGKHKSGPWQIDSTGVVTWKQPDKTLVPGSVVGFTSKATLSAAAKPAGHAGLGIALYYYTKAGKYIGEVRVPNNRYRLNFNAQKPNQNMSKSMKWTVPKGSPGRYLWVRYGGTTPGGSGHVTFIYHWDADKSGTVITEEQDEPLKVSLEAARQQMTLGQNLMITARTSGGQPPYQYLWQGESRTKKNKVLLAPTKSGQKKITVRVTDKTGQTAQDSINILVKEKNAVAPAD
jgi:hypothetical protein